MKDQLERDNRRHISTSRKIAYRRICVSAVMGISFALTLVGCTWTGPMRSEDQTYTGKDAILLQTTRSDIMDIVADVGKSMGYGVSDKEVNGITLSSSGSMVSTELLGKLRSAILRISANDNGRVLDFDVFLSGNFHTGSKEVATKLVNDFRVSLLETIARTSEKKRAAALARQLVGRGEQEPPIEQKPEAPKTGALSSTPSTVIREETLPAPVPAPEEIKATSTTPYALTSQKDKADKPSSQPISAKKWVCIKAANVRAVASVKGKIIKVLKKGEEVEFLGKSGN